MAIDYQLLFGNGDYDPCAVLAAIRPAYMQMLVEPGVKRIAQAIKMETTTASRITQDWSLKRSPMSDAIATPAMTPMLRSSAFPKDWLTLG